MLHKSKTYLLFIIALLLTACQAPKTETEVDLAEEYAASRPELAIELLLAADTDRNGEGEAQRERYTRIWQEAMRNVADRNMADSLQILSQNGATPEEMLETVQQYLRNNRQVPVTDKNIGETAANVQHKRNLRSHSDEIIGGGIFVLSLVTLAAIGFHFYDSRKNRIIAQQQQAIDDQKRDFDIKQTQSSEIIERMEREIESMRGQLRLAEDRREEMHRHLEQLQREREESLQKAEQTLGNIKMLAARGAQPSAEQWQQLMQLADARHPEFVSRLLSAYPKCGDDAIRVCALTLLGFDSNDICILTDSYRQKLYKTRARITKNIVNQKLGNTDDFYHALKQFLA